MAFKFHDVDGKHGVNTFAKSFTLQPLAYRSSRSQSHALALRIDARIAISDGHKYELPQNTRLSGIKFLLTACDVNLLSL